MGLIEDLRVEWGSLHESIAAFDAEFVRIEGDDEAARRLSTIPLLLGFQTWQPVPANDADPWRASGAA
ncbi:hypothetical protein [Ensifer aridi]|uniref:hypothetical protein n=1 Tax=Ensifer aridi TaxID=1708715 RepID=UPI00040E318B|nr:hypothetical protein [Ensifer aridi]